MKFAQLCLNKQRFCAHIIPTILFLGVLTSHANGPVKGSFTLETAVEQGLSNNPNLLAVQKRYNGARQRIPQVAVLPDPKLQVTHFFESVQTRTGPQENLIALSQGIPWPGTLRHREEMASAEAEALWFAYQAAQLNLVRQISDAYFEYAFLHKAIEITENNLRLLEELLPIVEEKVQVGGELSSLLRIKVEVGQAQDKRSSLVKDLETKAIQLQLLLASDVPLPAPEWGDPILKEWAKESLFAQLESTHPELRAHELKIQSAEAARELARLQTRPNLSLGINYIQISESVSPNLMGSGADPWGVMFSMTLPIHTRKYRAAKAEAVSRIRANEAGRTDTLNRLRSQLKTSLIKYSDARRRYNLYANELIPLAEQAWEISQTSYESGKASILDVIESERALLKLQLEYWRAAADLWQQHLVIETLTKASSFNTFQQGES